MWIPNPINSKVVGKANNWSLPEVRQISNNFINSSSNNNNHTPATNSGHSEIRTLQRALTPLRTRRISPLLLTGRLSQMAPLFAKTNSNNISTIATEGRRRHPGRRRTEQLIHHQLDQQVRWSVMRFERRMEKTFKEQQQVFPMRGRREMHPHLTLINRHIWIRMADLITLMGNKAWTDHHPKEEGGEEICGIPKEEQQEEAPTPPLLQSLSTSSTWKLTSLPWSSTPPLLCHSAFWLPLLQHNTASASASTVPSAATASVLTPPTAATGISWAARISKATPSADPQTRDSEQEPNISFGTIAAPSSSIILPSHPDALAATAPASSTAHKNFSSHGAVRKDPILTTHSHGNHLEYPPISFGAFDAAAPIAPTPPSG
jgi:hypothetical protein